MKNIALKIRRSSKKTQRGITLIELGVVAGLMLIAYVILVPNRATEQLKVVTPASVAELQRFMSNVGTEYAGGSATPFTSVTNAVLATSLQGSTNFPITGTGAAAVVNHKMSTATGTVTLAAGNIVTTGDTMQFTLTNMHQSACPGFAFGIKSISLRTSINGTDVQSSANGVVSDYDTTAAKAACTAGNTNTITFWAK